MKQYLDLARTILNEGTPKAPSRNGLPGSTSYFGYQFRHDLKDGFPLLTTKKINFKNIIVELLWFLKGDTNIKWLNENNFRMWNDDAFNYMQKQAKNSNRGHCGYDNTEEEKKRFSADIKAGIVPLGESHPTIPNYKWGDCGFQYGRLWRSWPTGQRTVIGHNGTHNEFGEIVKDQIREVLTSLSTSPEGRRHIITSWNPATLDDMALNACHATVQFNCRKLTLMERAAYIYNVDNIKSCADFTLIKEELDECGVPEYYLDCQMYQRSADTFLGVPYNIASYALLTLIFCKVLNMVPGTFIHTFGDVHIYDDHIEKVKQQITRAPKKLPRVNINTEFWNPENSLGSNVEAFLNNLKDENFLQCMIEEDIQLSGYDPHELIKGNLSTGLEK